MTEDTEGWTWLKNSRKWHYFVNGDALCGKWHLWRWKDTEYQIGNDDSPDNCAECRRRVKRRKNV